MTEIELSAISPSNRMDTFCESVPCLFELEQEYRPMLSTESDLMTRSELVSAVLMMKFDR